MADIDRSPCRQCGGPIEIVAQRAEPTIERPKSNVHAVRVCHSLLCPSNLNGSAEPAIA